MILTRDFVIHENYWQIASLVTQKALFTATHALFYICLILPYPELMPQPTPSSPTHCHFNQTTNIHWNLNVFPLPLWSPCHYSPVPSTSMSTGEWTKVGLLQVNELKILHGHPSLNFMYWCTVTLKRKDPQFDNFVITGGTVSCRNDNLWCHQWWQSCRNDNLWCHQWWKSCQIEDLFFSV